MYKGVTTPMKQYETEFDYSDYQELEHAVVLPREAMNYLACGRSTFYNLVRTGTLPAFRVGKQWRVKRESLISFVNNISE